MKNIDIVIDRRQRKSSDLISREALLNAIEEERQFLLARGQTGAEHILVYHCLPFIVNAPTVEQKSYERIIAQINPEWHFIKKIQLSEDCIYYDGLMVPRGEQVLLLTEQGLELDTADEDIDCQLVNRGDFDGVIAWLSVKDIIPSLNQEGNK